MVFPPSAALRAAVLAALSTVVRGKANHRVPIEKVASAVQLPQELASDAQDSPELDTFLIAVGDAQALWLHELVPDVLLYLALDGLVDMSAHIAGTSALTLAGVRAVAAAKPRNVTVAWFDRFMTPAQYAELVRYIGGKTRHSRDGSEIRGFVHDYIANVCARDGLRERILSGNEPSASCIRSWVWKQALSTFRNEGTDAQTRTVKGARTERDLRGETPQGAFQAPGSGVAVVVYEVSDQAVHGGLTGGAQNCALVDIVDNAQWADEFCAHQEALSRGMARLEQAVRSYKPGAPDRYARVLGHLARGCSPAEVAREEKVAPARAATLIAEVRAAGRERARIDQVRAGVLRYIQEEPMSTLSDLADLGAKTSDLSSAVSELIHEGMLHRRRGGSLELTQLGFSSMG
jgi:hypothetical protein